ncbi:gamma carbonic anhydrase family protein [Sulfuriferula plumbiphila]|uniref:Gamma carbonic anhydrase family protein n=1 Tax=Sulfuriferula plumbiphila TaxID=171865 RepID=A0A512L365_9PROT|nr:gamma carbonic anhydrase family protein [Sulfuriferula plumbiphila]BBP02619.1 gamma carbonic anhydrase family protein [Sulfuriferula plumbiphila]GEP28913.1 gamma carbonic anhydrase family protein [Sulfuriferula plumbiphila]
MSGQPSAQNVQVFRGVRPRIGRGSWIHDSARVIGDVSLGDNVSIWCGAVIRGDVNSISIGAGTNIQDNSVLHVSHQTGRDPAGSPLIIGANVTVGHSVILHGCTIGDECLIGMGSIVMDKVVIEPRVLLGAGSLVPEGKVLSSGHLYIGRPAKLVRALTDAELAYFNYSAEHYAKLARDYQQG